MTKEQLFDRAIKHDKFLDQQEYENKQIELKQKLLIRFKRAQAIVWRLIVKLRDTQKGIYVAFNDKQQYFSQDENSFLIELSEDGFSFDVICNNQILNTIYICKEEGYLKFAHKNNCNNWDLEEILLSHVMDFCEKYLKKEKSKF